MRNLKTRLNKTAQTANALALILLCFCIFMVPKGLADTPVFTATYKGKFAGWNLGMTRTLRKNTNGEYVFQSHAKNAFASITETSLFTVGNNAIVPISYEYYRKIFGKKKLETLRFESETNTAYYKKNKGPKFKHSYSGSVYDPALYQLILQLAFLDSASGKQQFSIIKRRKLKNYAFTQKAGAPFRLNNKTYTHTSVVNSRIKQRHWPLNSRRCRRRHLHHHPYWL